MAEQGQYAHSNRYLLSNTNETEYAVRAPTLHPILTCFIGILKRRDECVRWVILTGKIVWLLMDRNRHVVLCAECPHLEGQGCVELITAWPQKRGNCVVCVAAIRRCYNNVSICSSEFTCYSCIFVVYIFFYCIIRSHREHGQANVHNRSHPWLKNSNTFEWYCRYPWKREGTYRRLLGEHSWKLCVNITNFSGSSTFSLLYCCN